MIPTAVNASVGGVSVSNAIAATNPINSQSVANQSHPLSLQPPLSSSSQLNIAAPSLPLPMTANNPANPISGPLPSVPQPVIVPSASVSLPPPSLPPSSSTGLQSGVSIPVPPVAPTSSSLLSRTGDQLYSQMEKINSELLAMTYGAIVTQIIKDYKDIKVVNAELDKMGYNIGIRLIDEFLCRSSVSCSNFRETCHVIAKIGLKMFLGISGEVVKWRGDGRQCSIVFKSNPLLDFVELPQQLAGLEYCALICGCIRGALQQIQLQVEVEWVRDELKGSAESEIRLTLKEILQEVYNDEEEK